MSIQLNTFIDIISTTPTKNAGGFVTHGDNILASVRAYFEPTNSTEKWSNMATFSEANAVFKFRKIPDLTVTPQMIITSDTGRYEILSVEDVKQKKDVYNSVDKES
jgi:hypothetical protein